MLFKPHKIYDANNCKHFDPLGKDPSNANTFGLVVWRKRRREDNRVSIKPEKDACANKSKYIDSYFLFVVLARRLICTLSSQCQKRIYNTINYLHTRCN